MTQQGLIRHLDELGRIVIPKELRRALSLHNGDEMEIFIDNGTVILKKYSAAAGFATALSACADAVERRTGFDCILCDKYNYLYASSQKERFCGPVPEALFALLAERKSRQLSCADFLFPSSEEERAFLAPILTSGDIWGGVLLVGTSRQPSSDTLLHIAETTADCIALLS